MERRSLDGQNVTVHRVPVTSNILECSSAASNTRKDLECLFPYQRMGGDVGGIQSEEGAEQAVNVFKVPDGEFACYYIVVNETL